MKKFAELLADLFRQKSPLEYYIESKRPTNTAELDHWIRVYFDGQRRGL